MRLLIVSCCAGLVSGCAGTLPMPAILAALSCGPLIGQSYRLPVPPVALLAHDATAGAALVALDGQTAALGMANARTGDVIQIAESCDRRSAEVVQALKPRPWWKF